MFWVGGCGGGGIKSQLSCGKTAFTSRHSFLYKPPFVKHLNNSSSWESTSTTPSWARRLERKFFLFNGWTFGLYFKTLHFYPTTVWPSSRSTSRLRPTSRTSTSRPAKRGRPSTWSWTPATQCPQSSTTASPSLKVEPFCSIWQTSTPPEVPSTRATQWHGPTLIRFSFTMPPPTGPPCELPL